MGEGLFPAKQVPHHKCSQGDYDHHRHKDPCDLIHQFLHGGFASQGILHHFDDPCEHGFASDLIGPEADTPVLIDGPGINSLVFHFPHRHRFAAQHALIHP